MSLNLTNSVSNGPYQAINTILLQKAMSSDVTLAKNMLNDMYSTNAKTMEKQSSPHLGTKIDVRV